MNSESYSGDIDEVMYSPKLKLSRNDGLCASGTADTVSHDCGAGSLPGSGFWPLTFPPEGHDVAIGRSCLCIAGSLS